MTNIRHIFICYNKVLNKKNGCNVPQNFSIKYNKQKNRMINEKEVSRRTYYDEFDNKNYVQRGLKTCLLLTKIT